MSAAATSRMVRPVALLVLAATAALASGAHAAPSIGQKPLSDRAPGEHYLDPVLGEPGLFPGGANVPTGAHLAYGQQRLLGLVPRDAAGNPTANGWIGLLSVGMSNTNQEWSRWERTADGAGAHSGRVVLVDAAVGGVDATRMANPADVYWTTFDSRLVSAGLTAAQVQAVWLKQHLAGPYPQPTFTAGVDDLKTKLEAIVGILRNRLPNLQAVYFSSRIYAGHGNNVQEPFGFESAFAVKRAIADQIAGSGGLGTGPWLTWGPYLWADGVVPRSDGLTWQQADIEGDATHPSPSGEAKVASLLSASFGADPNAARWFGPGIGPPLLVRDAAADAYVDTTDPDAAHGLEPALDLTATRPVHVRFDLTGLPSAPLGRAKLSLLADPNLGLGSGSVFLAATSGWDEATITAANAPAASGPALRGWNGWSRGAALSADVSAAVQNAVAAGAPSIGFILTTPVMANSRAVAREAGDAPRLVLVFDGGELFRDGFELGTAAAWAGVGQ